MLDRIPFGPILVILSLVSMLLFPVLVGMGAAVSLKALDVPAHVNWAIPVTLLAIFSHAIIMFYFIGTGSRIKEVVREFKLEEGLYRRTLAFKARVFPLSTLTMALIMTAYVLGGGAHTHFPWTPPLLHGLTALAAAVLNTVLSLREVVCISENLTLVDDVDRAVLAATR
ncbi:MAG TPA: hypothetical protein VGR67_10950 [Candidatus Polarisedimenticolia bacterium]|jgi:hypothetical protein|nr:hypothetical protein [Candidatus Polarisedimenticolia bacterium]